MDDVFDDSLWGEPETERGTQNLEKQCLVDDLENVSSHRKVHGKAPVGVRSLEHSVALCSKDDGEVIATDSRSSRPVHSQVALEVGEQGQAAPHIRHWVAFEGKGRGGGTTARKPP